MKVKLTSQDQEKIIDVKIKISGNDVVFSVGDNLSNAECEYHPERDELWVYHIITPEIQNRHKGYGSAILKAIERVAAVNGIAKVIGYYAPEDKHTFDAYTKNGYEVVSYNQYDKDADEYVEKIVNNFDFLEEDKEYIFLQEWAERE